MPHLVRNRICNWELAGLLADALDKSLVEVQPRIHRAIEGPLLARNRRTTAGNGAFAIPVSRGGQVLFSAAVEILRPERVDVIQYGSNELRQGLVGRRK